MPKSTPTSTAAAAQNVTTRASKATATDAGSTPAGMTAGAAARIAAPTPAPMIPPIAARTRLSVSSWRTTRPRPAPRAERIASSRPRAVARASSRLATLAQQMSSTKPTTPRNSIEVMRRSLPTMRFAHRQHVHAAATVLGQRARQFRGHGRHFGASAGSTVAPAAIRPIPRKK